jgi:hypothetical protein
MTTSKSKLSELKARLSSFRIVKLNQGEKAYDISLTEDEVIQDLQEQGNNLLLGRFTEAQVIEALKENGVWKHLADKGYPDPKLTIRSIDPFRQKLKIHVSRDCPETEENLLCELRVFDARLKGTNPLNGSVCEMDALVIDWLLFQNPRAKFKSGKQKLPGQMFPGLGILRLAMSVILDLAKQIGKEAVVNIPEYYHNAVLYHPEFRFFLPEIEGKFLALKKFLSHLSLAEASSIVSSKRIINKNTMQVFQWKAHEQILGLSPRIREYFSSQQYLEKVQGAENRTSFELVT